MLRSLLLATLFAILGCDKLGLGTEGTPAVRAVAAFNAGEKEFHAGNFSEAKKNYLEALKEVDSYPEAHFRLGLTYLQTNDFGPASLSLKRASELQPKDAEILGALGKAYALSGKLENALTAYNKALTVSPNSTRALEWKRARIDLLIDLRKYEDAGRFLKELGSPDDPQSLTRAARIAFGERRMKVARDAIHKAGASELTDPDLAAQLGTLMIETGETHEAVRVLEGAAKISHSPRLLAAYARALIRDGQTEKGVAEARRAARLASADAELQIDLADALAQTGDLKGALEATDRAEFLQASSAHLYMTKGKIHEAQAAFERALEDYNRAAEADGIDASPFIARGRILIGQKKYDQAITALEHALARQPGLVAGQALLASALARRGVKLDRAQALVDAAMAVSPGNAVVLKSRAVVLLRRGRYKPAIEAIEAAMEAAPNDAELTIFLKMAQRRRGSAATESRARRGRRIRVDHYFGKQ